MDARARGAISRPLLTSAYPARMSGVFISHASADAKLVDEFVDSILRLGCDLGPSELFYSSGADTGVPSGEDLLAHVRTRAGEANLVVAVITPTYQTRPVCVAELGAAWAKAGSLFPLLVPGMPRGDLEGVLSGMLVRYLDDEAALDELHDRILDGKNRQVSARTWGKYKAKWLASVNRLAKGVPQVRTVSEAEVAKLEEHVAELKEALAESEGERAELRDQLDELSETLPADVVKAVRLPKGEKDRYLFYRKAAREALADLNPVVADAIFFHNAGRSMPWPDRFEEPTRHDYAQQASDDGYLSDRDEGLDPNPEFEDVALAIDAVGELSEFLGTSSTAFQAWFRSEYKMPASLDKRAVWTELLG